MQTEINPARADERKSKQAASACTGLRKGRRRGAHAASCIHCGLRAELVGAETPSGRSRSEAEIALGPWSEPDARSASDPENVDDGIGRTSFRHREYSSELPVGADGRQSSSAWQRHHGALAAGLATQARYPLRRSQRQREADAADAATPFIKADEAFPATIADVAGITGIGTLIQQVKLWSTAFARDLRRRGG